MDHNHFIADIPQKAIIEKDGSILLTLDTEDKLWELPGGRINESEKKDYLAGLKREVFEEIGINIEPTAIFDTLLFSGKTENNHFAVIYLCKIVEDGKEIDLKNGEVTDAKWIDSYEELGALPMRQEYRDLIKKYFDFMKKKRIK